MKYRQFIEDHFVIDEPQTGQLVPFVFNRVQEAYYEQLKALGIEKLGIGACLREFIVKARREGFSSLILALFAADDILQQNPTESLVVSYKDDATNVFRKRYRRFILSYAAQKQGIAKSQILNDANILEQFARHAFSVDANDLELRHNRAHFYCGTASARTGGRGGVLQKLLFSEAAHYPDNEKITAKEIIDGTSQQVDKQSGWIFQESTGNGQGNYFYRTYEAITQGLSRYLLRFFGWRSFYTEKQFKELIVPEFTDPDMLKQEYPESIEEAFLSSSLNFITPDQLLALCEVKNTARGLEVLLEFGGVNYIDQCETIRDFVLTFTRTHPNKNIYLGLDTAKQIDKSVLSLVMEKELTTRGGIKGICIDSTGQGDFVPDWFERNTDWYIHRINFSRPSKSILWKNLQVVITEKLTDLPQFKIGTGFISPEWQHFYKQLIGLQKQIIGQLLVVEHPRGQCRKEGHDYDNCPHHDDYADSWALAELLYVTLNGVPKGQRPPENKSNFDASLRKLLDGKASVAGSGGGVDNFD